MVESAMSLHFPLSQASLLDINVMRSVFPPDLKETACMSHPETKLCVRLWKKVSSSQTSVKCPLQRKQCEGKTSSRAISSLVFGVPCSRVLCFQLILLADGLFHLIDPAVKLIVYKLNSLPALRLCLPFCDIISTFYLLLLMQSSTVTFSEEFMIKIILNLGSYIHLLKVFILAHTHCVFILMCFDSSNHLSFSVVAQVQFLVNQPNGFFSCRSRSDYREWAVCNARIRKQPNSQTTEIPASPRDPATAMGPSPHRSTTPVSGSTPSPTITTSTAQLDRGWPSSEGSALPLTLEP